MRYSVKVGERRFEVEIVGDHISVDGQSVDAEVSRAHGREGRVTVGLNGARRIVSVERWESGWLVHRDGDSFEVEVENERTRLLKKFGPAGGAASGDGRVKAPMPGLVIRVNVEEGTVVEKGQGLLVLEAMKMENEIKAPVAGKVAKILAESGQPVDKGVVLVELSGEG